MNLISKWQKLNSNEKKKIAIQIGLPVICISSIFGIIKLTQSKSIKDTLITRGGKLLLVDVTDEDNKIELKDIDGNKINYDFNQNTLAVVSPRGDETKKIVSYEVMLFNEDGDITFGFMEGKYLSDKVLDTFELDKTEIKKYFVNDINGIYLSEKDNEQGKLVLNNEQVLATVLDNNEYKVFSINGTKIISNDVIATKLSTTMNDLVIEEEKKEQLITEYTTYVPLNIRKEANTNGESICILEKGTEVKKVNNIDIYNDGNYEWVYVLYTNPLTNTEEEGWIAKKNLFTNEDYLVNERTYSNLDVTANLLSESAIALDVNTGQILFDKDAFTQKYPASITKVLTAYLVLKYGNLDDYLEYSENAVSVEGHKNDGYGTAYTNIVSVGNKFSVKDAIYLSLLKSDNSTTVALSEYVEKITGRKFTDLMNEEAHLMGCKKCNFTNSYGYEDLNHHVSACDMAKITAYIYKNQPGVIDIMGTREYNILYNGIEYNLINDSVIFNINEYAIGSKTGYTSLSGQTMISIFKKGDNVIVTVTLNGNGRDSKNLDADLLARSSFEKLESSTNVLPISYNNEDVKVRMLVM